MQRAQVLLSHVTGASLPPITPLKVLPTPADVTALGPLPNGRGFVLADGPTGLAKYPHLRVANGFLYVSGLSSRRPDNTHVGAVQQADGSFVLDIGAQTQGCLDNLRAQLAAVGADLTHVVDLNVFLTDMKHFPGYNAVYNRHFDSHTGPTRTTVAVKQLPHPNLLIEIKAVCVAPKGLSA